MYDVIVFELNAYMFVCNIYTLSSIQHELTGQLSHPSPAPSRPRSQLQAVSGGLESVLTGVGEDIAAFSTLKKGPFS